MRSTCSLLAMTLTIALATVAGVNAQQAPRSNQLLFDASGRQLEMPRDTTTGTSQSLPAVRRNTATSSAPAKDRPCGRVPLEGGTFGLEMDKKLQPDQFPDGRPIPGIESQRRQNNSPFVGFSLSVPTN